jgi:hypothetical protein
MPVMRSVVEGAKELAIWAKDNAGFVADLAKGIGAAALVIGGAGLASKLCGIVGALQGMAGLAAANPVGLVAAGVAGAAAIIYREWKKVEQPFLEMDEAYKKWLTGQITGAKTAADLASATSKVEKAFAAGTIEAKQYAQALDMIDAAKARVYGWGDFSDITKGLKITVKDPKTEAAAAAALAEEVRKHQIANDKAFRDRALESAKAGLTGYAKDVSDVNAEIAKRSTFVDERGVSHYVALTRSAWKSIIAELENKWQAFKDRVSLEHRKEIAEYLKGEEEVAQRQMEWEARRYQQRLQHDGEIAERKLAHLRDVYAFQEQRAGFERDAKLRALEGLDAQTVQQKVAVEQHKAAIEIDYLEKVHEVKQRLYDLDTETILAQEELLLRMRGYEADKVREIIAELTQHRQNIRDLNNEANDAAIDAARENASARSAQIVRDHNREIFDSLKQQAGGVFDALLQKSQSVWSAIGNSLKAALLTAIKDVVTSRVAAMLMSLFGGGRVSFASSGSGGGILGGIGAMLGIGAAPVFAGTGGGTFGSGPVNGNPMILSATGGGGGGGLLSSGASVGGGLLAKGGAAGLLTGLKGFLGFDGGVQFAPGMATTWAASTFGQKMSALGRSNAALMACGAAACLAWPRRPVAAR